MKKGVVITAAVVAAAAVGGFFMLRGGKETAGEVVPPPVVRAEAPKIGDIELYRNLVGVVEPSDLVYVIPKMAGEITAVYVAPGDSVTEGQLLCEIDTKQVDAARLQMEAAQIQLEDAKTNLARMQVLYASGDISAQAYEQIESGVKSAQIAYDGAKLAYDNQIEFSKITATISGKIESSSMEVHGMAAQTTPLCVISGEGSKAVSFAVTEAVLDHVQAGSEVHVEKNGSVYTGVITEVNTMVDPATGLFKVKAAVEDDGAFVSGSSVKLYVTSDKAEQVMTIPVDALYYQDGKPYVYTYDNGIVHEVSVETGISDENYAEIVSGLAASDLVITTWSPELYEGAPADLIEETQNETGDISVETVGAEKAATETAAE